MLKLLRASAGSGKTYRLTLEYITMLLTIPETPGGTKRRLRRATELFDACNHILAITFTNKATNEMKARIVNELADLADPEAEAEYLKAICELTGSDDERVRFAAYIALRYLLNNYSEFQVSTIDSFFQTILRTFAYETSVPDTYSVELDSKYVTRVGVDTTLSNYNTNTDKEANYWLEHLSDLELNSGSRGWNIFEKSGSKESIYSSILSSTKELQSEAFKRHLHEIDAYWASIGSFREIYENIEEKITGRLTTLLERMKEASRSVRRAVEEAGFDINEIMSNVGRLDKALTATPYSPLPFKYEPDRKKILKALETGEEPMFVKVKKKDFTPEHGVVNQAIIDFYRAAMDYEAYASSPEAREWGLYRKKLVYFSLMMTVRNNATKFLKQNDVIELAETNTLLQKVIGDDDAPFIYERLGTRIDHYLIDEFQDTSRMQWENLVPLMRESESRSESSLIIGDAKQSIYRFRNADPSLITHEVAEEFPILPGGNTLKDNTNYRTRPGIVRFNNSFFYTLARLVDEVRVRNLSGSHAAPQLVTNLYGNVIQPSGLTDNLTPDEGYVEIRFPAVKTDDPLNGEVYIEGAEEDKSAYYKEIPLLVADMLRRGYKQREIAVLAPKNDQLQLVINEFLAYNEARPQGDPAINFVSEESLKISDSEAVKKVVAALRMITRGHEIEQELKEMEERDREKKSRSEYDELRRLRKVEINDLACSFNFMMAKADRADEGSESYTRLIEKFLETPDFTSDVDDFLNSLYSAALPSMVEAIITRYIAPTDGDGQAPYLAAFQDAVMDYCTNYSADPASFLNWWEQKGSSLSISSPEGADAVSVMTIHKSKGLEFRCVVIPNTEFTLLKQNMSEWLWVRPSASSPLFAALPPYIPVEAQTELEGTSHAAEYVAAREANTTDRMNMGYVGLTRAVDEMYIYCQAKASDAETPVGRRGDFKFSDFIAPVCHRMLETCSEATDEEKEYLFVDDRVMNFDDPNVFRFGTKPERAHEKKISGPRTEEEKKKAKRKEADAKLVSYKKCDYYFCRHDPERLKFRESETLTRDVDDPDPRSRGNMMHEMLSYVRTPEQLPAAGYHMKVQGKISAEQQAEYVAYLEEKLRHPRVASWFADGLEVFNERAILSASNIKRPDRVIVDKEGNALVIDYKFGAERPEHRKQVNRYIDMLKKSGRFTSVRGVLWYVTADTFLDL